MPPESAPDSPPSEFFFADLAIVPPLDEFRRLYEKKLRSFESGDGGAEDAAAYERAFRLGEQKIEEELGVAPPAEAGDEKGGGTGAKGESSC